MPKILATQQRLQHSSLKLHAGQEWNGLKTQFHERTRTKNYGQREVTQGIRILLEETVVVTRGTKEKRIRLKDTLNHSIKINHEEKVNQLRLITQARLKKKARPIFKINPKNSTQKNLQIPSILNSLIKFQLQWQFTIQLWWRQMYQTVWYVEYATQCHHWE